MPERKYMDIGRIAVLNSLDIPETTLDLVGRIMALKKEKRTDFVQFPSIRFAGEHIDDDARFNEEGLPVIEPSSYVVDIIIRLRKKFKDESEFKEYLQARHLPVHGIKYNGQAYTCHSSDKRVYLKFLQFNVTEG
jgi:hypothetical protein